MNKLTRKKYKIPSTKHIKNSLFRMLFDKIELRLLKTKRLKITLFRIFSVEMMIIFY